MTKPPGYVTSYLVRLSLLPCAGW